MPSCDIIDNVYIVGAGLCEATPDLTGLVRALIEVEMVKSTAFYAHLSAPKDGSLETLVSAAADYFEACFAVHSALQDMG